MIFEALQSELFGFDLYALSSKIFQNSRIQPNDGEFKSKRTHYLLIYFFQLPQTFLRLYQNEQNTMDCFRFLSLILKQAPDF